MRIGFNLEYQTTFGEELVLNILSEGKTEQHKMGTIDGYHWTCELSKAVKTSTHIDYYYCVMRGDQQCRTEWLVMPHRLEFEARVTPSMTTGLTSRRTPLCTPLPLPTV